VAVCELVEDREHLLAELKERVLGRQSASTRACQLRKLSLIRH
jgi:hypothetical protein